MSHLDKRVNKLERTEKSADDRQEQMSQEDMRIIQQLSRVLIHESPGLKDVTEADTDPRTWKEIQQTLSDAKAECSSLADLPKGRSGRRPFPTNVDDAVVQHALDRIKQTIADSAEATDRHDQAMDAARKRLADQA
jgi:hypothetical protein